MTATIRSFTFFNAVAVAQQDGAGFAVAAKFIIFYTQFLVFNTQFLVLNTKFIIFTHPSTVTV